MTSFTRLVFRFQDNLVLFLEWRRKLVRLGHQSFAAIKIQTAYRKRLARCRCARLTYRVQNHCAGVIQRLWRRGRAERRWMMLMEKVIHARHNPLDRYNSAEFSPRFQKIDFRALKGRGSGEVVYDKKKGGKMLTVTLPKLVEVMVNEEDDHIVHVVIATMPNFTEPCNLLHLLTLYLQSDPNSLESVIRIMKIWVSLTPRDFDLPAIRIKLDELLLFVKKGFGRKQSDSLSDAINVKIDRERRLSPMLNRMAEVAKTYMDLEPIEAARQLTLANYDLLKDLNVRELNMLAWEKADGAAPIIKVTVDRSNKLSNWVTSSIVVADEDASLSSIEWWINTAQHCLELRNYSDLVAIIYGLQHHSASRLFKRWAKLAPEPTRLMNTLVDICSMDKNYKNIRRLMMKATMPMVPCLAIHLKDLVFIEENPTIIADQISMEKMELIYKVISSIKKSVASSYDFLRVPAWQVLLWPPLPVHDVVLHQKSLVIEPRGSSTNLMGSTSPAIRRKGSMKMSMEGLLMKSANLLSVPQASS